MDSKRRTTQSPLRLMLTSQEVRQHLQQAGKELALVLQSALHTIEAEACAVGLHCQYPYLQSALGNIQTAVERFVRGTTRAAPAATRGGSKRPRKGTKNVRGTHRRRKE